MKYAQRLHGVHADLIRVLDALPPEISSRLLVVEGLRTQERQQHLFRTGATRTMRSRHLTGHAVDLAPMLADGTIPWGRWDLFRIMADSVKEAARRVGIPIEWGGDWETFRDGPHFQLPWSEYP